jgi:hypothetical protein
MKLSRTGWNNVIIFSVMTFILVINVTNEKLYSSDEAQSNEQKALFAEHSVILSLSVNQQVTIERIGKAWRATPAKISGQALDQMMLTWHEIEGDTVAQAPELDRKMALVISVELAGKPQAQLLNLFITNDEFLIFHHQQKRWLAFPLALFSQLIPNELLAS